jgi:anti-anti-sigma factor
MNSTELPALGEGVLRLFLVREEGDLVCVRCEGGISLPDFQPGRDPLARLMGYGVYARKVLLDLERASYLDTSGITWLIRCHHHFEDVGGVLVLHSIPPRVRAVLALLHLERVFHTAADLPAARARAAQGKS